jgi:hypothetical protein
MTYAAHPTTPRLLSITLLSSTYCTYFPKYYSVFSCYTEAPAYYSTKTAEYYTEVAKYFSTPIYTSQSRLATQKLLFRATLKWNTTLMLQSTTPRPTLHLATPSYNTAALSTPKKLPITQPRTLPGIEEFKYYPAPNYYHLRFICITPAISRLCLHYLCCLHLYMEVLKYLSGCVERLLKYKID